MATIKIVINSTRVMRTHVTISCRYCIALEVMLLFLVFLSRSEAGALFVRGVYIVQTSIALPFIGRFPRDLQRFSEAIALSGALHISHFC